MVKLRSRPGGRDLLTPSDQRQDLQIFMHWNLPS